MSRSAAPPSRPAPIHPALLAVAGALLVCCVGAPQVRPEPLGDRPVAALALAIHGGDGPVTAACPGETLSLVVTATLAEVVAPDLRLEPRAEGPWRPTRVTVRAPGSPGAVASADLPPRYDCAFVADHSGRPGRPVSSGGGDPGRDAPDLDVFVRLVGEERGLLAVDVHPRGAGAAAHYWVQPEAGSLLVRANGGAGGGGGDREEVYVIAFRAGEIKWRAPSGGGPLRRTGGGTTGGRSVGTVHRRGGAGGRGGFVRVTFAPEAAAFAGTVRCEARRGRGGTGSDPFDPPAPDGQDGGCVGARPPDEAPPP